MYNEIQYEAAQARMKEQMRKAAVWRMQRAAIDAHKHSDTTPAASGKPAWISAISRAFGGKMRKTSGTKTQALGEQTVVYISHN